MLRLCGWLMLTGVLVFSTEARAQRTQTQFQFGMHITRPRQVGDPHLSPGWSHNYWLGISRRQALNATSWLHAGIMLNLVNYRFRSTDSPRTIYTSLNYMSIPVQLEYKLGKNWGLLTGAEPKCYFAGYQYTAEPGISHRIRYFSGNEPTYHMLNLGFRLGLVYAAGPVRYLLQGSTDLLPFRQYGPVDWYDSKITFGFTISTGKR